MNTGAFQIFKKSPFRFNGNNIIFAPPEGRTAPFSEYVEYFVQNLEKLYDDSTYIRPKTDSPVTGNESEFYFTFNNEFFKKALQGANEKYFGRTLLYFKKHILRGCNLLEYYYKPPSWKTEILDSGRPVSVAPYDSTFFEPMYFDILGIDIIEADADTVEELSKTTDRPGNYGCAAETYFRNTTFRFRVQRNRMLEAYINGDFDSENAPRICGGLISAAGRSMLLEKFPGGGILAGNAYPIIKPAGGDNSGHEIKSFFNSLSGNYYAFCVGTFTPSAAGGSPKTAVYTFLNTAGTAAFAISEEKLPGIVTYTDAAEATFAGNDSGVFTPSDVFVLPVEFLSGTPLNISDSTADIKASKGYYLAKSVILNSGVYRSAKGYSAADFGTTVTIGTNKTRVNVGGSLGSETKTADGAPIAGDIEQNIFAELRITKNGGFRISLFVNGSEYDITDDFSVPLTPTNVSKSELQAQKISRLSSFVQQGGGVVAGAAAVAAGIASGGAALVPAVAAGAGAIFSNASGIAKNIADGAPKQAARQNGAADGIGNATTNGGLYFETFQAENFDAVNAAADSIGYACAIPANGVGVFEMPAKKYATPLLLKVENAKISAGRTDADTEILIESKLNAGALICYGMDALKAAAGV